MAVHLDEGCEECDTVNVIFKCDDCEVRWAGCWHENYCWVCYNPGERGYTILRKRD